MSYHEQITTCHPDHTDVRERLHDVIESGCREGINVRRSVLRNATVDDLEKKHNLILNDIFRQAAQLHPPRILAQ